VGTIFENKLTFRKHITFMAEKCTKLIYGLSNLAKLNLGAKPGELKTLYTGGILRILLYRTPG